MSTTGRPHRVWLAVAATVQIGLAVAAWTDLARRSPDSVRGRKWPWALLILVNFVGPIAYFTCGRRSPSGQEPQPERDWESTARYVALTTYRADGSDVSTPVWFARQDDELVVQTEEGSGKVRRIRHDPAVTVAPCDVRGHPLADAHPAVARILGPSEEPVAEAALSHKYGALRVLFVALAAARLALRRRPTDRVYLGVRPTPTTKGATS